VPEEVESVPGDVPESDSRRYVRTARSEAFSDGVFAIAITLLVLDLAIGQSGSALHRVLDGWPFYLAYLVSFLTIGAAWLGHNAITDRLTKADAGLLRLNLVVLLAVSVLPFPTRLVAEGIHDASDERLFVAMPSTPHPHLAAVLHCLNAERRRAGRASSDPTPLDCGLLLAVDDPTAREVVRRELDLDPIARVDPDPVPAHPAGRVAERLVPVVEEDFVLAAAERLDH